MKAVVSKFLQIDDSPLSFWQCHLERGYQPSGRLASFPSKDHSQQVPFGQLIQRQELFSGWDNRPASEMRVRVETTSHYGSLIYLRLSSQSSWALCMR